MKKILFVCVHNAGRSQMAEAVLHLMAEHPEALSGHHLAAQFIEEMASVHD